MSENLFENKLISVNNNSISKQFEVADKTRNKLQSLGISNRNIPENLDQQLIKDAVSNRFSLNNPNSDTNKSPLEIIKKYGFDKGNQIINEQSKVNSLVNQLGLKDRSFTDTIKDGVIGAVGQGVGIGLTNLAGNIVENAGEKVLTNLGIKTGNSNLDVNYDNNKKTAREIAQSIYNFANDANEKLDSWKSQSLQNNNKLFGIQNQLTSEDNARKEQQEIDNGSSPFYAGAKRVVNDYSDTISNAWDNGNSVLGDVGAQGLGSLLLVPPVAKGFAPLRELEGLANTGSLALKARGLERTGNALSKVGGLAKHSDIMATNALLEGSGANQQTQSNILKMGYTDLSKNSPRYNELINSGLSPEDARSELASESGNKAGLLAGLIGGATAPIAGKFERNPLAKTSLGSLATNIIKEPLEETVQEGGSQLAQNYATKDANKNQDLLDQVGLQGALGSIGGLFSVGATALPANSIGIARDASSLSKKIGSTVVNQASKPIKAVAEYRAEKANSSNPTSNTQVSNDLDNIKNVTEVVEPTIKTTNSTEESPNLKFKSDLDLISKTNEVDEDFSTEALDRDFKSSSIKKELNKNGNIFNKVEYLTKLVQNDKIDNEDKQKAYELLLKMDNHIENFEDKISNNQEFRDYLNSIKVNDNSSLLDLVGNTFNNLKQNKIFQTSKQLVINDLQNNKDITPTIQSIINGEISLKDTGQPLTLFHRIIKDANKLSLLPELNEEDRTKLNSYKDVLNQYKNENILSKNQKEFISKFNKFVDNSEFLNENPNINKVSQDFLKGDIDNSYTGLKQYNENIIQNLGMNNLDGAKQEYQRFINFKQTKNNKNDALLKAQEEGIPTKATYTSYNRKTGKPYEESINYVPNNSDNLVKTINSENAVLNHFNKRLLENFPELNSDNINTEEVTNEVKNEKSPLNSDKKSKKKYQKLSDLQDKYREENDTKKIKQDEKEKEDKKLSNNETNKSKSGKEETNTVKQSEEKELDTHQKLYKTIKDNVYPLFKNNTFKKQLNDSVLTSISSAKKIGKRINTDLNNKISEIKSTIKDKTKNVLEVSALKPYKNILQKNEDNTYSIKPEVMDRVSLASMEGLVQTINNNSMVKNLNISDDPSNLEVRNDLNNLISSNDLILNTRKVLKTVLKDFISNKDTIQNNEVLLTSLAATILNDLTNNGYLKNSGSLFLNKEGDYYINNSPFNKEDSQVYKLYDVNPKFKEKVFSTFSAYPDILSASLNDDTSNLNKYVSIGKPIKVSNKQKHSNSYLTDKQVKAIKVVSELPFYVNKTFTDLLLKNEDNEDFRSFLLGKDVSEIDNLNNQEAVSLKGKDITYQAGLRTLRNLMTMKESSSNSEDPFYFAADINTANRLELSLGVSPQNNTVLRELITPINTEIDLTNPNNLNDIYFFMAQNLDIKTHNIGYEGSIKQAKDLLETEDFQNLLKSISDKKIDFKLARDTLTPLDLNTTRVLSSLIEFNKIQKAIANNDNKVRTHLYIESDGVTNGLANSLAIMTSVDSEGDFFSKLMNVGGLTKDYTNLSDYRKEHPDDFYKVIGRNFLKDINNSDKNPTLNSILSLINNTTEEILTDINSNDILDISRSIIKNPATIVSYGSGSYGVGKKIANTIISNLYAKLSTLVGQKKLDEAKIAKLFYPNNDEVTAIKRYNELNNDIKVLFDNKVDLKSMAKNPKNFKFKKEDLLNFYSTFNDSFSKELVNSIKSTISENSFNNLSLLSKFFNLSNLLNASYAENISKEKNTNSQEYISTNSLNDYENLINPNQSLIPTITSDTSNIQLRGKNKGINKDGIRVESLTPKSKQNHFNLTYDLPTVDLIGIAGQALTNISYGDGTMIVNFLNNPEIANKQFLPIFDGVHIPLDQYRESGKMLNKAVFDSWLQNPFKDFLSKIDAVISNFSEKMLPLESSKYFYINKLQNNENQNLFNHLKTFLSNFYNEKIDSNPITKDTILNVLKDIKTQIEVTSLERENLINQIKSKGLVIDQMSTGSEETTYNTKPENTIKDKKVEPLEDGIFLHNGEPINVKLLRVDNNLINKTIKNNKIKELLKAFNLTSILDQTKLISFDTNNKEVLEDFIKNKFPDMSGFKDLSENVKGFYDSKSDIIYLLNKNNLEETIAHEILHASLFNIIKNYYKDTLENSIASRAIQNIENLMYSFMGEDYNPLIHKPTKEIINNLKQQINNELLNNNPEIALSEFISWSLTNPFISNVLKNKLSPLKRLSNRVKYFLNKMFGNYIDLPFNNNKPTIHQDILNNALILGSQIKFIKARYKANNKANSILYSQTHAGKEFDQRLFDLQNKIENLRQVYLDKLSDKKEFVVDELEITKTFPVDQYSSLFGLNDQQKSTYITLLSGLKSIKDLDNKFLVEYSKLFSDIQNEVKVNDFFGNNAQEKYNSLFKSSKDIDLNLANFVALANTSEEVRSILDNKEILPTESIKSKGKINQFIDNIGNYFVQTLSDVLLKNKGNKDKNYNSKIQSLTNNLKLVSEYNKTKLFNFFERGNEITSDLIAKTLGKITETSNKYKDNNNKIISTTAKILGSTSSLLNKSDEESFIIDTLDKAKKVPNFIRALAKDLVGRTNSNSLVYDSKKRIVTKLQRIREQYRENIPNLLGSKFKNTLNEEQSSHLTNMTFKSNLYGLMDTHSLEDIYKINSNNAYNNKMIKDTQKEIDSLSKDPETVNRKIDELVDHVLNGALYNNLLRNPIQIAKLFGEKIQHLDANNNLIKSVDKMIAYKLLKNQSVESKELFNHLYENENEALKFSLDFYKNLMKTEFDKQVSDLAKTNYQTGFIPSFTKTNGKLIVIKDSDAKKYIERSYKRIGKYEPSTLDKEKSPRSYYYSSIDDSPELSQGLLQNIQSTYNGIDSDNGLQHGLYAGYETNNQYLSSIKGKLNQGDNKLLIPVYNKKGELVYLQKTFDPEISKIINKENNFFKLNGMFGGRQIEESLVNEINNQILLNLKNSYDKDPQKDTYINILDRKQLDDKVYQKVVDNLNPSILSQSENIFGNENTIMVKRSMIDDTLGYHKASIGDAWTGNTRWDSSVTDLVKDIAIATMGVNGFNYLVNAEKFLQDATNYIKTTIVTRSGIIAIVNHASNILQLISRNVPITMVKNGIVKYTNELNQYFKINDQILELELEKNSLNENDIKYKNIDKKIKYLNNAIDKLSISPLIKAGEIGSISDVGNYVTSNGKRGNIMEYFSKQLEHLPQSITSALEFTSLSKSSSLFKALQKFNEYGDYIAKAIYFEHLTKNKGLSEDLALGKVTEEYINYDISAGRFRQYLEDTGLLWFYNFKLRIFKIALNSLKENPLTTLMASILPIPSVFGNTGLPITDNIFAKIPSLGYTTGFGMGIRGLGLNPIIHLLKAL